MDHACVSFRRARRTVGKQRESHAILLSSRSPSTSLHPCFPSPPVSATLFSRVVAACKNKNKKRPGGRRNEREQNEKGRGRKRKVRREREREFRGNESQSASLSPAISFPPRVSKTTLERAACTENERARERERERERENLSFFPSISLLLAPFLVLSLRVSFRATRPTRSLRLSSPKSWRDRAIPSLSPSFFLALPSLPFGRGPYVRQRRAFHGNTCVQLLIFVFFRRVPARGTAHVRKYLRSVFLGRDAPPPGRRLRAAANCTRATWRRSTLFIIARVQPRVPARSRENMVISEIRVIPRTEAARAPRAKAK